MTIFMEKAPSTLVKGDTVRCFTNSGGSNSASLEERGTSKKVTTTGGFSSTFTWTGGTLILKCKIGGIFNGAGIYESTSARAIINWTTGTSTTYNKIVNNGGPHQFHLDPIGRGNPPIYLERLTQLSTNTSHITKNSLE